MKDKLKPIDKIVDKKIVSCVSIKNLREVYSQYIKRQCNFIGPSVDNTGTKITDKVWADTVGQVPFAVDGNDKRCWFYYEPLIRTLEAKGFVANDIVDEEDDDTTLDCQLSSMTVDCLRLINKKLDVIIKELGIKFDADQYLKNLSQPQGAAAV